MAHNILVIGAGPAGLYAAKKLAKAGHSVAIVNRDIRPGGLAEYGVFFNKYKMKAGLRKQYAKILETPSIRYYGGITVGKDEAVTFEHLRNLGFDAIVVAVGAQGIKWVDVENSTAIGVMDAKELVYHYNGLPPYAQMDLTVGRNLGIVGAGNVALDIAHWACHANIPRVTLYIRRGPFQRKWTRKEIALIGGHIDRGGLRNEMHRLADIMMAAGEDPDAAYAELDAEMGDKRIEGSSTVVGLRFACQPKRVLRDDTKRIRAMLVDENQLFRDGNRTGCVPTGRVINIPTDMLVFAVGDAVDTAFGLPVAPRGGYEVLGDHPYRVADTCTKSGQGIFVVGWSRKASDGLVGKARKDAETGCDDVLAYLEGQKPGCGATERLEALLVSQQPIDWEQFKRIRAAEEAIAAERDLPDYRFTSNDEMRAAL